ncbi:ZinT/AdcA family metal-binding protein, partial [Paracoccus sp. (in: a-proteobacteria)]|uniref:ZinT/AdcA family metal-binding protein n=1 Tax=Paracoccus sp. TaxID=267 RepID=UPI0039E4EE98
MRKRIGAAMLGAILLAGGPAMAEKAHDHEHAHDHAHAKDGKSVYNGYFQDAQVADRPLSDWAGDWQSVYPLLQSGALDPVMAHKAEHGDMSAQEYRAYYEAGYKTDVERIEIKGDEVGFHRKDGVAHGHYASDG